MHREAGVTLAGVAHNNPHYSPGWSGFFGVLVILAACPPVIAGAMITVVSGRHMKDVKKWYGHLIGPLVLLAGLAVAAFGVWLL